MAEVRRANNAGAQKAFAKIEESFAMLTEEEKPKALPTLNRIRTSVVSV